MSARYTGGLVYNAPGGWSGYFDGSGDYLTAPDNAVFDFGSGNFTLEAIVFPLTSTPSSSVFGKRASGAVYAPFVVGFGGTLAPQLLVSFNGSTWGINFSSSFSCIAQTWNHIAVTRNGSTFTIWVNGQSGGTASSASAVMTNTTAVSIGATAADGTSSFNGYISNARIVKGTAVYTANFTPPTGALVPISGTSLLTCAYSTFRDGSTNNFTVTANGNTAVSNVNPFPTSQLPNPALGGAGNGVYTMSQYAALKAANLWPAYDPYYENVTLNLHGNAGTVLPFNTDASTNNFQVTQVGDTRPSNYTPFIANGYWSNYFIRSSSQYLTVSNSGGQFSFGTDAFTIECWVNLTSLPSGTGYPASYWLFGGGPVNSNPGIDFYINNTQIGFNLTNFTSPTAIGNHGISAGTWYHVAVVRGGTSNQTLSIYVNGSRVATASGVTATADAATTGIAISAAEPSGATSGNFDGYISNHRIVKGSAVYDPTQATLTVPTTPLTAVANTQLLTCQSNRFVDNSTNAFTITTSGSPSVNPLQPFTAPTGTSAYGSGYFDGTGDYLTVPDNTALELLASDFTIECWVYPTGGSGTDRSLVTKRSSGSVYGGYGLFINTSNNCGFIADNDTSAPWPVLITGSTVALNEWTHLAATRSGSTWTVWKNGVSIGTATASITVNDATTTVSIGAIENGDQPFTGYITNARIVKGTAVYTSAFTPPTTPLTAITNTSLLTVQTNAPSQNNTFLDSSTNNFPITRFGNTTQGTFTPYGSNWSNYFDGSGDYLRVAYNSNLYPTSSGTDYTVECWVYPTANIGGFTYILGTNNTSVSNWQITNDAGTYGFTLSGVGANAGTVVSNQWAHLAMTRNGTTMNAYLNGVRVYTTTASTQSNNNLPLNIGMRNGSDRAFTGYISNVRIVNGTALYTGASFTVPTAPLTAVTNTVLLTCADNRFIDDSTNAYTITKNGDVSVQRFSPFSPTSAYSTSVIGGSGYFDGTGDYLTSPSNPAFDFGTGNFTIEAWGYRTSAGAYGFLISRRAADANYGPFSLGLDGSNVPYFACSSSGSSWLFVLNGSALPLNAWFHLAGVRNGTTFTLYVNGTSAATTTSSSSLMASSVTPVIGAHANGSEPFAGYISNARISNTAVYTTAFTPSTTPLTAISGTQLLYNMTNAGILDNAMMNDLETVGNAQISTSVKKYGSASMYFDGSGDYLTMPATANLTFGSGDFTVECWIYLPSLASTYYAIASQRTGDTLSTIGWTLFVNSSKINTNCSNGSSSVTAENSTVLTTNTWYHVAAVRSGNNLITYVNGIGSTPASFTGSIVVAGSTTYVGYASGSAITAFGGYIDDLRITKGVARYTANFTPPTSQLQDQ